MDETTFSLNGEEFFGDKPVFYRVHQSHLVSFSVAVCQKGEPIEVEDRNIGITTKFRTKQDFKEWFTKNQSRDIDFGFSDLSEKNIIVLEVLKRLSEIEILLIEELQILSTRVLNPWRIDGGYKRLDKASKLGVCSIQKINENHPEILSTNLYNLIVECFSVPNELKIGDETIISHSRSKHEEMNKDKLIEFCKLNLKKLGEVRTKIQNENDRQH